VLKWNGTGWAPSDDETGIEFNPFVSSDGITQNTFLADHFVFGSSSMDDITGTDDNIRMFFNKSKGAFRAGEPYGTGWNNENVGNNSAAFGIGTVASGLESFAAGHITLASGHYSTAMGAGTYAIGMASTALGGSTKATGMESTSMGYNTVAAAKSSVALGQYNIGTGNGTTWIATDPVFEIGIGSSNDAKANAVTVLKNGNFGIGSTNPSTKLEVAGQVKITGGNPGAGKVLTSDAGGLASWQNSPEGLTLPFSGVCSSDDAAFSINQSGTGAGIYVYNPAPTGEISSIVASSNSSSGKGVSGYAYSETGNGIGVFGSTVSPAGVGVKGIANTFDGFSFGVVGETKSSEGTGIWGNNTSNSGTTYGVQGTVASATGFSGYFTGGKFYISGNTGIGTNNPGAKLEVAGQVKITGGSPGAGKVLTSDANGLATWLTPAGLTLPYAGSVSTSGGSAFSVANSGNLANGISASSESGNGLIAETRGNQTSGVSGNAYGSNINSGVSGSSTSSLGTGVSGIASSLTGTTIGVSGLVLSPDGYSGYFDGAKFYISGNAGIGVTAPSAKLDINGQIKIRGGSPGAGKVLTSDTYGLATWESISEILLPFSATGYSPPTMAEPVFEISNTGSGPAIQGNGSGSPFSTGLLGFSNASDNGRGVLGYALAMSGEAYGVQGVSNSSAGIGVYGEVFSTSGSGKAISGKSNSSDGYSGYFDGGKFYISGNTGIGTQTPSQKLHVKGSAAGNAVVFIEPNKWTAAGDYGEVRFGDANHYIRGEHTTGMTFYDANKFSFTGGNVGIGINSPAARLDVSASQGPNIIIRDSDAGAGRPGIQFVNNDIHFIGSDDTTNEIFGFYSRYGDNRSYAARLNIHGPATSNWGKYIGLTHDGTNGIIDTDTGYLLFSPGSGRVGIGTAAPEGIFDVAGGKIIFRPNASDKTKILVHDYIGSAMRIYTDFLSGTPYDLILGTYPNGHSNQLFLKQSNGFVGIRTSSPLQALDVNGNARFQSIASDAYFGALNRKSDGTLTTATSDIRLKNNIKTIKNSLEKVLQLRGVSFTWKSNPEYGTRIGFIAQEFEQVIPELVFTNEVDGYKGINYAEVTAVLVEAIKELKAENDMLKQRLEKIEALSGFKAEK
jgi:ribosomal protein S6E (S10)